MKITSQQQQPRSNRVSEQLETLRVQRKRRVRAARWGWFLVYVAGSVPLFLLLRALDYDWNRFAWAMLLVYLVIGAWLVVTGPLRDRDERA